MKKLTNSKILIISTLILFVLSFTIIYYRYNHKKESIDNTPKTQEEILYNIKDDLKRNLYTLDNAKVYINPFNNSPLTALITFTSNSSGKITVTVKGQNNNDLITEYSIDKYNYIPIYGLYENYSNTVILTLDNGISKTFNIKTEKLTNNLDFQITNSNNNLYTIANEDGIYLIDNYQNIRGYVSGNYTKALELPNGHILTLDNNTLKEIDYLGKIYNEDKDTNIIDYTLKNDNIVILSKNNDNLQFKETNTNGIIESELKLIDDNIEPINISSSNDKVILSLYDNLLILDNDYNKIYELDNTTYENSNITYPDFILGSYLEEDNITILTMNMPEYIPIDDETIPLTYRLDTISISDNKLVSSKELDESNTLNGYLNNDIIIENYLKDNSTLLIDNDTQIKFSKPIFSAFRFNNKMTFDMNIINYFNIE